MHKTRQNLCRIVDKIDVLVEVDVHTGTHVDLVSQLGLVLSTFNRIFKNPCMSPWCTVLGHSIFSVL